MARILITSGPTRQYLDPVRYISNGSSGQMGAALAAAAIAMNHDVIVVSGPVTVAYPVEAEVVSVVTTQQMLEASLDYFPSCDGAIGAAAPCDYQPVDVAPSKLQKTGNGLTISLTETPDILANLGGVKQNDQWIVGFALETENGPQRAYEKLIRKSLDLIVLNGTSAIDSNLNSVTIIDAKGAIANRFEGPKTVVAKKIMAEIAKRLIQRKP